MCTHIRIGGVPRGERRFAASRAPWLPVGGFDASVLARGPRREARV